jgi:hypothetical protein
MRCASSTAELAVVSSGYPMAISVDMTTLLPGGGIDHVASRDTSGGAGRSASSAPGRSGARSRAQRRGNHPARMTLPGAARATVAPRAPSRHETEETPWRTHP